MRFFSTSGPVNPQKHYFVDHELLKKTLFSLITQRKCIILYAPYQSGKTTFVKEFTKTINGSPIHQAVYINLESLKKLRNNIPGSVQEIFLLLNNALEEQSFEKNLISTFLKNISHTTYTTSLFRKFLQFWASKIQKPLLLFIDNFDSLIGDVLLSILKQINILYSSPSFGNPVSICLVTAHNLYRYQVWSPQKQRIISSKKILTIPTEIMSLPFFTAEQIRTLYAQHTKKTGQKFTQEALEYVFLLTEGQPWLVNAFGKYACNKTIQNSSIIITKQTIEYAKDMVVLESNIHTQALAARLQKNSLKPSISCPQNSIEHQ